jgi:hypothetical protein
VSPTDSGEANRLKILVLAITLVREYITSHAIQNSF